MAIFKIDMRLFEDFNYQLARFQEHFGPLAPRASKNAITQNIVLEARVHAFWLCQATLRELLQSMYTSSDLSKKEGSIPDNAIGELIGWMYRERMLSPKEVDALVDLFEAGMLLSADRCWLNTSEKQKIFDDRSNKLSRYYHSLSTFSGMLTQRLVVTKESQHART